jgi:hypothetical protein
MSTQFLGVAATVYGVPGALKSLLQAWQMLTRRSSGEVSARFLATWNSHSTTSIAPRPAAPDPQP